MTRKTMVPFFVLLCALMFASVRGNALPATIGNFWTATFTGSIRAYVSSGQLIVSRVNIAGAGSSWQVGLTAGACSMTVTADASLNLHSVLTVPVIYTDVNGSQPAVALIDSTDNNNTTFSIGIQITANDLANHVLFSSGGPVGLPTQLPVTNGSIYISQ